jgi:hypothetical protein
VIGELGETQFERNHSSGTTVHYSFASSYESFKLRRSEFRKERMHHAGR